MSSSSTLFASTVEKIDAQADNIKNMFSAGTPVSQGARALGVNHYGQEKWDSLLLEAEDFVDSIVRARRPLYAFQEAMSTDLFPALFADSLDRQLYGAYSAAPTTWQNYARRSTVNDFRRVKRFATTGIRGLLKKVAELAEHERRGMEEKEYGYEVEKFEAGFGLSFEAMINDDLDMFRRLPQDLAQSATDSEEYFVTSLYAASTGFNTAFYNTGNDNLIASNAALTRASLQAAITKLMSRKDERDNPIVVTAVELVVGPGLALQANEILNATEYRVVAGGNTTIISGNGVAANLRVSVNYWLPAVINATSNNRADTSWFLFANPVSSARPALEIGFLRGYEAPQLFEKVPDMRRIGGGGEVPWSYDHGSSEKKIQHIFGGAVVDPLMTLASSGAGS